MAGQKKRKRVFAGFLAVISLSLWIFERVTNILTDLLGRWVCGSRYMQPVDGCVGDKSCGFNTDMYLSLLLVVLFVLSTILYALSRRA